MVLLRFASAIAVASVLVTVAAQGSAPSPTQTVPMPLATPTVTFPAKAMVEIGCYPAADSSLENHGFYLYQTPGNCQLVCLEQQKNVLAVSDGENCWCGDKIPNPVTAVSNSSCDTQCSGDKSVNCGGPNLLWVALTGKSLNKVPSDPAPSSSSATPSATASSTPSPTAAPKKSTNTVAIAVGVVVGIIALVAIGAAIFLLMRRRRQRQAEEDYRRSVANQSNFTGGGKLSNSSSSMNDSRLDPSFVDRRTSSGSIADNEDYSRRILKVTNV